MQLSLVVPIYNEIDNLVPLVTRIQQALAGYEPGTFEAILINDGSTDGSDVVLRKLAAQHAFIKVVHFRQNYGQTAAFDAGFKTASGEWILTLDADLQNDPMDLPLLSAEMAYGIGCVCGVRTKRNDSWVRRMSSKIANGIRNWLSEDNITDTGCSLKLFRREALLKIKLFEGMHRFLPTLIKMEGYRVIEVPVSHSPRLHGQSKYGIRNRVLRSFKDLLAVRWMKKRYLNYNFVGQYQASKTAQHVTTEVAHHGC